LSAIDDCFVGGAMSAFGAELPTMRRTLHGRSCPEAAVRSGIGKTQARVKLLLAGLIGE
jgi:hypothetical protein